MSGRGVPIAQCTADVANAGTFVDTYNAYAATPVSGTASTTMVPVARMFHHVGGDFGYDNREGTPLPFSKVRTLRKNRGVTASLPGMALIADSDDHPLGTYFHRVIATLVPYRA